MTRAVIVIAEGPSGRFKVSGQTARALLALVAAMKKGVTALDVSSWAYRFSAYCFELRHKHGLAIERLREPHEGGWHGRHVLHCS
ncbi:MAG: hypothetical protein IPI83_11625 [Sphingomonadales bacterium]|nr:hypothetical protein [Sphingomonadales bacterium]